MSEEKKKEENKEEEKTGEKFHNFMTFTMKYKVKGNPSEMKPKKADNQKKKRNFKKK